MCLTNLVYIVDAMVAVTYFFGLPLKSGDFPTTMAFTVLPFVPNRFSHLLLNKLVSVRHVRLATVYLSTYITIFML